MRCLSVAILIFILSNNLSGQFYSSGEAPGFVTWQYINTAHFKLVFPSAFKAGADELANKLESYYSMSKTGLKLEPKKTPVLIQSLSVLSNGYVTLAPLRMELVSTPPQDSYAQDWLSQLSLHEFRHVAQLSQFKYRFTKALSWATGEIAPGIVSSQMPAWFYEGDAVYNETRFSNAGRGRSPAFKMPLRTLLMNETHTYSYDKAIFGSYRNFVPNHYQYGYEMVNFSKNAFGNQVWPKALEYVAAHPYLIWPLALYLKKNYKVFKNGLYHQTMDSLKIQYNNDKHSIKYINYLSSISKPPGYVNYTYPVQVDTNRFLVVKSGLIHPASFVIIDREGIEKRILITGQTLKPDFDLYRENLIWTEIVVDPRWEQRSYSIIKQHNLLTGKTKKLSHKTKYFGPDFSPDGKSIVLVETDDQFNNFITVLSASNGNIIQRIPTGSKSMQSPEWISHDEIAVISVDDKGKQIEKLDLASATWEVILPYTFKDITDPLKYQGFILFHSSFNGIDNIYAVKLNNNKDLYQITFSSAGAFFPSLSTDTTRLVFSNYTLNGFDIVSMPIDTLTWQIIPKTIISNLNGDYRDQEIKTVNYETKRYRKAGHLINIHSWIPFYTDLEEIRDSPFDTEVLPGFTLFSQNLLSTFISSFGYSYDHGFHRIHPSVSWRGFYPVIEISGKIGGPHMSFPLPEGVTIPENPGVYNDFSLQLYVPLVINRGRYNTYLQPLIELEHSSAWYYTDSELHHGLNFLHAKLGINNYQRTALRDLYPRWGQALNISYTQSPWDQDLFGALFSMNTTLYFPGPLNNHHLILEAGYQAQYPSIYYLPLNRIDFPRGYSSSVSGEFMSLFLNYAFPIAYPDFSLGPLLYLKRLRMKLFYDLSYGNHLKIPSSSGFHDFSGYYKSYGFETLTDLHFLRFIFPISSGFRLGYLPDERKFFTGFLFSIHSGIF